MSVFEIIGVGTIPNDNTGDKQRVYLIKINDNFAQTANLEENNTFEKAVIIEDAGSQPLLLDRSSSTLTAGTGINFQLRDSGSSAKIYAGILGGIVANTPGSEDGFLSVRTMQAGALTEGFKINELGGMVNVSAYNITTATAANMVVTVAGLFRRSTSSERYKKNIEPISTDYSKLIYEVAEKACIFFKSKAKDDNPKHTHYGISAEKLAEIEPRLVSFGLFEEDYEDIVEVEEYEEKGKKFKRNITKKVPKNDVELKPSGVQYDRFAPLIMVEMNEQRKMIIKQDKKIEDLEKRLIKLENK